ncbi:hypothetical protein Tco_0935425, partial [Tanacetum coccineum]
CILRSLFYSQGEALRPTECNRRKLTGAALLTELYAYGI